jgi:hypothetical protein
MPIVEVWINDGAIFGNLQVLFLTKLLDPVFKLNFYVHSQCFRIFYCLLGQICSNNGSSNESSSISNKELKFILWHMNIEL